MFFQMEDGDQPIITDQGDRWLGGLHCIFLVALAFYSQINLQLKFHPRKINLQRQPLWDAPIFAEPLILHCE